MSQASITIDDPEELQRLEKMIEQEQIHINVEFLNEDKGEFDGKKRKSSIFEIKRHYENEIESLRRDLELI